MVQSKTHLVHMDIYHSQKGVRIALLSVTFDCSPDLRLGEYEVCEVMDLQRLCVALPELGC